MVAEIATTDLRIGDLVHRIPWTEDAMANLFGAHFRGFVVPRALSPDVTIRFATPSDNLSLSPAERLDDSANVIAWSGPFGAIRLDPKHADCALLAADPRDARWILRFITGALLSRHAGLLLHGAALVFDGRGYLYLGPSDAGKSTLARMVAARGGLVLGDESVVVRITAGRPVIYGTPFTLQEKWIGRSASAPLVAIYLLDRSAPVGRIDISPSRAVTILAQSLFFRMTAESLTSSFLETAAHLTAALPATRLSYRLDAIPWPP
jgi:hypothetical protein